MTEPNVGDSTAPERVRTGCPMMDFDHHAVDGGQRSEVWKGLRDLAPVLWSDHYDGFWVATSFDAVAAVLGDAVTFSSAKTQDGRGGQSIPPFIWRRNVPGEYDGEEHQRLRQVMLPALTAKAIEARRGTIERLVSGIFDDLEGRPQIDPLRDIAVPVPARSMFDFMGLPQEDALSTGLAVAEVMSAPRDKPPPVELDGVMAGINQRMLDEVAARRRTPGDDIISQFANLENGSRLLDEEELLGVLVTAFLLGGMGTATRVLASAISYLDTDRKVRRQLIAQPELIPNFVQDVVRWVSPASAVGRTVTAETVLCGQTLKPGDRILAMIGSANLDEQAFDNPDQVDPTAWRNRHLGFGLGAHFCPGAVLARLEIELALRELLRRMPDYELVAHGGPAVILRPQPL